MLRIILFVVLLHVVYAAQLTVKTWRSSPCTGSPDVRVIFDLDRTGIGRFTDNFGTNPSSIMLGNMDQRIAGQACGSTYSVCWGTTSQCDGELNLNECNGKSNLQGLGFNPVENPTDGDMQFVQVTCVDTPSLPPIKTVKDSNIHSIFVMSIVIVVLAVLAIILELRQLRARGGVHAARV